jgi:hypothetical protein
VTFDKAIMNASALLAQDLTINAGTGDVTFTGVVGEDATGVRGALGQLVINSAGETKFVSTVDAASLKTDVDTLNIDVRAATNKVTIQGGRITTAGEQHFAELVVLDNAAHATVLNTTNSNVTFDKAIMNASALLAQDLTINAGTGDVTFTGVVGEDATGVRGALGQLVINSAGVTSFVKTVDVASISTDAAGRVVLNGGRVTSSGSQSYFDPISLGPIQTLLKASSLSFNKISASDAFANLNLISSTALVLGTVELEGDFNVYTGAGGVTGGVSQVAGTWLNVKGLTNFVADTKPNQVVNLNQANHFGSSVSYLPMKVWNLNDASNTGSWSSVSVQTNGSDLILGQTIVGALSVQTLGGNVTQTGTLDIAGSTDIKAGLNNLPGTPLGDIILQFSSNSFNGPVSLIGHQTSLSSAGDLVFQQVLNKGNMTLSSGGSMSLGAAFVAGGNLTLNSGTSLNLGVANISGDLTVNAHGAVQVGAPVSQSNPIPFVVGGNLNIDSSNNAITQVGPLVVAHNTTLNAGLGVITLPNLTNSLLGTVTINAAAANVATLGDLKLAATNVAGTLVATSANANIIQSAPMTIGGAAQFNALGDVNLSQVNNVFGQSVAVDARNATVVTSKALNLGASAIKGNLNLDVAQGDLTQVGAVKVGGVATFLTQNGNVTLTNSDNLFADIVNVDTSGTLSLTTSGPLTIGKVTTAGDTALIAHGKVDLGTSTFGAKINVNSGGFDIVQSGPIKVGGNSNFDAGSAKIDLFNPKNSWSGSILYKGGIVMINHPQLLNAVNAGTLVVRVEASTQVAAVKVVAPSVTPSTSTSTAPAVETVGSGAGSDVSISVARPASVSQSGLITVTVSSEAASSGKGFSFALSDHLPSDMPRTAQVGVTLLDGKPLPEWLRFDAQTQKVVATSPPPGAFPLQIKANMGGVETVIVITEQPQ